MKSKAITWASRDHSICCGHTVLGHEGKCAHLHGHNYKISIHVEAENLDAIGRVVDFSVIKEVCCEWLEVNWDHKFLVYQHDVRADALEDLDPQGVVIVPFNPTAENMAVYLLQKFQQLFNERAERSGKIVAFNVVPLRVRSIAVQETDKCSVTHTDTSE